jgi:hypothetical protein
MNKERSGLITRQQIERAVLISSLAVSLLTIGGLLMKLKTKINKGKIKRGEIMI